ncbi:MAG: 3-dehydroquinate synthase [Gammaproteobacteria bacterium]|nr:3-dehydroquinate synthase [Gammaproteobacteria bacterium]
MKTLNVDLGERTYPIHIGHGLIDSELLGSVIKGNQLLLVTNETIAPLYLDRVLSNLKAFEVATVILPDGENHKNIGTLDLIFSEALTQRFSRNVTMVALGGGVVGDIVGFAAATYQRGTDFLQIPTTLLSQVDSSVGGKTGVNHRLGKNMIGAFHQPIAVLIDTDVLETLPAREMSAGIAEVIKYGLLGDVEFLSWIEGHLDELIAKEPSALSKAIEHSCKMKAAIVARDERESGVRALLNLGHTFGHAIEAHLGYSGCLHGEAVGTGMVLAARLSHMVGMLSESDVIRTVSICERANLPVKPPKGMTPNDFLKHMAVDKKNIDGRLRLILMRSLGAAFVEEQVPMTVLDNVLQACCH